MTSRKKTGDPREAWGVQEKRGQIKGLRGDVHIVRRPSEISSAFHKAQGIPLIDADLPARWQAGIAKKGHFWMETI
jgi:hypothetical protein